MTIAFSSIFSRLMLLFFLLLPFASFPREIRDSNQDSTILAAAKELMNAAKYCALITQDASGAPQARTMDPFPVEENMVVWLGTNRNSRKVGEITNDPRVTLFYQAPNGAGYVTIRGHSNWLTMRN